MKLLILMISYLLTGKFALGQKSIFTSISRRGWMRYKLQLVHPRLAEDTKSTMWQVTNLSPTGNFSHPGQCCLYEKSEKSHFRLPTQESNPRLYIAKPDTGSLDHIDYIWQYFFGNMVTLVSNTIEKQPDYVILAPVTLQYKFHFAIALPKAGVRHRTRCYSRASALQSSNNKTSNANATVFVWQAFVVNCTSWPGKRCSVIFIIYSGY